VTAVTEPLQHALLAQAHADAAQILAHADQRASRLAAGAAAKAEAILAEARAEGAEAASLEGAQDRATARRHARALVLAAQRQVWEELGAASLAAARELDLEHLADTARAQLGDDAVIERDPGGGLRASLRGRSVDYTCDALVDRCLAMLGSAATELWQ
jgi:vacuolar-type H+-ATPase subunit E/Vma4